MDALNLIPTGDERLSASPTIYINNMYEHYKECNDLQEVLQSAAKIMTKAFEEAPGIGPKVDFDQARENIVMVLVNTEQNKGLLENIPSRPFQDLSVIYRWVVDTNSEGISSTIVNNVLAEKLVIYLNICVLFLIFSFLNDRFWYFYQDGRFCLKNAKNWY